MSHPLKIVEKPRMLFRPDPVLGWTLTPDHAVRVGHRKDIIQHIDAAGWRDIAQPQPVFGPRIATYGCSFTYGTGLSDNETFTARLQQALPDVQLLNRGIGGHGTVQNLLQLRRDIANGAIDAAVFAMISDHRFRNVAHPQRMRQYLAKEWYELGVEHVPVAQIDTQGQVRIIYRTLWQPVITQADFDIFLPDDYMLTQATFAVVDLVRQTAKDAGIPIRFALLDCIDPEFNLAFANRLPEGIDVSTPYDPAHTFLPADIHPNAHANALYADRLTPVMQALRDEVSG